jgi:hypothetical protein
MGKKIRAAKRDFSNLSWIFRFLSEKAAIKIGALGAPTTRATSLKSLELLGRHCTRVSQFVSQFVSQISGQPGA